MEEDDAMLMRRYAALGKASAQEEADLAAAVSAAATATASSSATVFAEIAQLRMFISDLREHFLLETEQRSTAVRELSSEIDQLRQQHDSRHVEVHSSHSRAFTKLSEFDSWLGELRGLREQVQSLQQARGPTAEEFRVLSERVAATDEQCRRNGGGGLVGELGERVVLLEDRVRRVSLLPDEVRGLEERLQGLLRVRAPTIEDMHALDERVQSLGRIKSSTPDDMRSLEERVSMLDERMKRLGGLAELGDRVGFVEDRVRRIGSIVDEISPLDE